MKYKTIELTRVQGVPVLFLNRPKKLNAISSRMTEELEDALQRLRKSGVKGFVITGRGRAFCAGVDLTEIRKRRAQDAFERRNAKLFDEIESFPGITIASINGLAYGGGFELTLSCDLRFAAAEAVFCLPELKLGILPSAGGLRRLPPLIGFSAAKEVILTAKKIPALEAQALQLVHHVTQADSLLQYSVKRMKALQGISRMALRGAKLLLNASMQSSSPDRIAVESFAQALLFEKQAGE